MRWPAKAARLLVASVLATTTTMAASPPAPAPGGFGAPTAGLSLYGDFLEVGNGSLRCPVAGEPTRLGGGPAQCSAATRRQSVLPFEFGSNNDYYLRPAGQPDATTFDSSAATFQLPEGTTVRYAQLDWGGNTGAYRGTDRRYCTAPVPLLGRQATLPPAPAAASPRSQQVRLTVDAGLPTEVPLATVQADYTSSETADAPGEMYSDWADVTDAFAGAAADVSVNVANVWAAGGFGCAGGWSLIVVFGSATPSPAYPTLRQFDVYTTHLRQGTGGDARFTLPEPAVTPGAAHVEMGLTAYDGDWNNSGDTLTVDGATVTDPCGGPPDNFFTSCADGAVDPAGDGVPFPNNMSVDAKVVTPQVGGAGGDIAVELRTQGDQYVLQSVVVAEDIHPSITETVALPSTPLHAGDTATYTVSGANDGDIPLTDVRLADTTAPDCQDAAIGDLAPGQTYSVTCHVPDAHSFDDVATVTARWPHDQSGLTVSVSARFSVTVLGPQLAITQSADPATTTSGGPVTVTFTVTNKGQDGDAPLTDVTISEPDLHGCAAAPVASLDVGASATETCTARPERAVTSSATATAKDATGATVSATSDPVTLTVADPALVITDAADPSPVGPGGIVTFTVTVHNTGDVPLSVQVTNDLSNECAFAVTDPPLPVRAARSQTCTVHAPATTGPFPDTAAYTATPAGLPIAALTGQARASADVRAGAPVTGGGNGTGEVSGSGAGSAGSGAGSGSGSGSSHSGSGAAGAGHGGLAWTGVEVLVPVVIGGLLLAGGVTFLVVSRRRRTP